MDSRILTVVFTDVAGSTRLYARVSDAEAVGLVREVERRVREALPSFRGAFVKATEEGPLLTFEAPADAVRCAGELHRICDGLARTRRTDLFARVAIHSGEVILGEGDVHGNTVNLAARLLSLAGGCETCVTEAAWAALEAADRAGFTDHGPEVFKGFACVTRVWRKSHPNPFLESTARLQTMREADAPVWAARELPRRRRYRLVFDLAGATGAVELAEGEMRMVGGAPRGAMAVSDPALSESHAAFAVVEGVLWVFDLQGASGLLCRGRRIHRRRPLEIGSVVELPVGTVMVDGGA